MRGVSAYQGSSYGTSAPLVAFFEFEAEEIMRGKNALLRRDVTRTFMLPARLPALLNCCEHSD